MKTIALLRHAKSSWSSPSPGGSPPTDKSRTLAPRGERDAPRMARWIAAHGIKPEQVLCSTAVRTRQTLDLVKDAILDPAAPITYRDDLYLAEATALLEIIRRLPDRIDHVMFVGHDPGLHDLAHMLSGAGDIALCRLLSMKFPTAGLAVIEFATDRWREIGPGAGSLRHFMAPKRLPPE